MSLDSDVIVDRRRIRRKLTFWRVAAAMLAIAAIVAVGVIATPGGRGALRDVGLDRPHQYRGPDPQRPGSRRGAGAAGEFQGRGRHRAHQFARRHHRRLRTALRRADAAEGEEAAGRGGRGTGGIRRLHHGDRGRSHRRAADLAGRLDRRAVSVSEFYRPSENRRRQGRGSEVLAAESSAQRLRADQSGSARRAGFAGQGFLCVVSRPGERAARHGRRPARQGRGRAGLHRPSGGRSQADRSSSATRRPR